MRKGEQATASLNDKNRFQQISGGSQLWKFFPIVVQLNDKDNEISPGCDSEPRCTNSENIHSRTLESATKAMP